MKECDFENVYCESQPVTRLTPEQISAAAEAPEKVESPVKQPKGPMLLSGKLSSFGGKSFDNYHSKLLSGRGKEEDVSFLELNEEKKGQSENNLVFEEKINNAAKEELISSQEDLEIFKFFNVSSAESMRFQNFVHSLQKVSLNAVIDVNDSKDNDNDNNNKNNSDGDNDKSKDELREDVDSVKANVLQVTNNDRVSSTSLYERIYFGFVIISFSFSLSLYHYYYYQHLQF